MRERKRRLQYLRYTTSSSGLLKSVWVAQGFRVMAKGGGGKDISHCSFLVWAHRPQRGSFYFLRTCCLYCKVSSVVLRHATLFYVTPCYVMLCFAMIRYANATFWCAMVYYRMVCYAMVCYARLFFLWRASLHWVVLCWARLG